MIYYLLVERSEQVEEFDYEDLLSGYGIEAGDLLDVSSDMLSIMVYARKHKKKFSMSKLLAALKNKVGPEGTVMIRAFSWDFCHEKGFDIRNTKSQTGSLGNEAMKDASFKRTRHPIYSWWVWGKYQQELLNLDNVESFSEDSPFAFLYDHGGKQVRIGIMQHDASTLRHFAEMRAKVPFRYIKMFHGNYVYEDGSVEQKGYSMYVRRLDCEIDYDHFIKYDDASVVSCKEFDGFKCWLVDLKSAIDYVYRDLTENFGLDTVFINGVKGYKELL